MIAGFDMRLDFQTSYTAAFEAYCFNGQEDALLSAHDLARAALAAELTLAEYGAVHHAALHRVAQDSAALERAEDFYLEGVAVFDMAIRGYKSSVTALRAEVAERNRAERALKEVTNALVQQRNALDSQVKARTAELEKRAEELEQTNRRLNHTNREQADFTYALSHDLKTPINTIDMLLDEIVEDHGGTLGDAVTDLVATASGTALRMRGLIDDVLDYSRIVEHQFQPQPVDLNSIARDLLNDAAATIRDANAVVRCGTLPVVSGSAFQLRILMSNLLSNALKYRAPDRTPQIEIEARTDAPSGRVVVSVSDNGIGMPEHQMSRIFELFKRLHRYDEIKGSGIGLALCKRVAENHATSIEVSSTFGVGSTFSIQLTPVAGPLH